MRKNILTLILLTFCFVTISAQSGLKRVYDESIDPLVQIEEAVGKASKEGKYVVCQVGGNWCPWCLRFADFVTNDSTLTQIIDENFIYIHVNYNPRRSYDASQGEKAALLMQRLNNPSRFGFPVFVVLDEEGNVIHIQDSVFLEEGKGYNKEKVMRFFDNWKPSVVKKNSKGQS